MRPLALALACLALETGAWACLNAVTMQEIGPKSVARAERLIADGKCRQALRILGDSGDEGSPDITTGTTPELSERIVVLRIVCEVRSYPQEPHTLRRFARQLRQINMKHGDDPYLTARLAEVLLAQGQREAALTSLEELAARDLVPDPEAWATLAALRSGERRSQALATCRERAARPSVCEPPAPR